MKRSRGSNPAKPKMSVRSDTKFKIGRFSQGEEAFIRASAGDMSPSQIAQQLGRNPDTIRQYIEKNLIACPFVPIADSKIRREEIKGAFKGSVEWKQLREQLTPLEMVYFEEKYAKILAQFKDDLLATEEMQVFQLIKVEILMDAIMRKRKAITIEQEDIENQIKNLLKANEDTDEEDENVQKKIDKLERRLEDSKNTDASRHKEWSALAERHERINNNLKASRHQRIEKIEQSKDTFLGLIKMLEESDAKDREGRQMAAYRLAAEKEKERLGKVHLYQDGIKDRPILNAETVLMNSEEIPMNTEREPDRDEGLDIQ